MSRSTERNFIIGEVGLECIQQDIKWGEQNHPDGTGDEMAKACADFARKLCEKAADNGKVTWRHILREEMQEAFAEIDPDKLRTELIQVAAVAIQWVHAIDRRKR